MSVLDKPIIRVPATPEKPIETLILESGQCVNIQLPSGKTVNIEVTQDTADFTVADFTLFSEELEDGKWGQTFPRTFKTIGRGEAVNFIKGTNGKFFSLKFIKRTDGTLREMLARTGVKKGLAENPSKPGTDFGANNLIAVFDVQKDAYRSIPIEGIKEIMIDGEWHAVTD